LSEIKESGNLKKITLAGIMAALVFVVTWVVHIPVPGVSGAYINIGDSIIYCASFLLGGFYGAAAAGIGSFFSDLLLGSTQYMFGTLVIKGIMGLICAVIITKPVFSKFVIACIAGGAFMVVGYGIYELIFFGAGTAMASLPFNLIQWAGGVIIALPLYKAIKVIKQTS